MNGKLISREIINEDYELYQVKELESDLLLPVVVKRGLYDFEELKNSPWIAINTTIVKICNANKGHEYPEGTLGYGSKGF